MPRGIIAPTGSMRVTDEGVSFFGPGMTPEEVRYYILYWDKVVIPTSAWMNRVIPDEDILVESGVVERPKSPRTFGRDGKVDIGNSILEDQAEIARTLMLNPGDTEWTIHQFAPEINLPEEFCAPQQKIRVELLNALPVPNATVSIYDVLDFKYRRADELANLHKSLDDLYREIYNDPEPSDRKNIAIRELLASIKDVNDLAGERWKISTAKFDIACEISALQIIKNAGYAAVGSQLSNLLDPLQQKVTALALAGKLLADTIKVTFKVTKTFEPAKNNMKLAYLSKAHAEGVLPTTSENGFSRIENKKIWPKNPFDI